MDTSKSQSFQDESLLADDSTCKNSHDETNVVATSLTVDDSFSVSVSNKSYNKDSAMRKSSGINLPLENSFDNAINTFSSPVVHQPPVSKNSDDSDETDSIQKFVRPRKVKAIASSSEDEDEGDFNALNQNESSEASLHSIKNDSSQISIILDLSQEPEVIEDFINNSIVEIDSSDDENELKPVNLNKTTLRQSTLDNIVKVMPKTEQLQVKTEKKEIKDPNIISCSLNEYREQSTKVSQIRSDLFKIKNLLKTMNLDQLVDNGDNLKRRCVTLEEAMIKEDAHLKRMVVNEKDSDEKPESIWDKLKETAGAVVPRTFGKQAMETYMAQKTLTMESLKDLHGSLKNCPDENVLAEDPEGLRVDLMKHQKRALAWMLWREKENPSGGLLADDMGLGKTLTMLSLVLATKDLKEDNNSDVEDEWKSKQLRKKSSAGTLVICPATLISQWEGEVRKHCRRHVLNIEIYHGTNRESSTKKLSKKDLVITTYNLAMREHMRKGPLFQLKWRRIILDEAHTVRNHKSQTSEAVCSLLGKSRWALTGTPVHNKELDLYALLKFLRCSPFDNLSIWKLWVVNKNAGGQDRLNMVMASIMLRRTKIQLQDKGELSGLPEKKMELIEARLDKDESQIYQKVLIFSRTLFAQFLHQNAEKKTDIMTSDRFSQEIPPNSEYFKIHQRLLRMHGTQEVKSHEILVLLLRLRQICCHPSLIVGMLNDDLAPEDGIEEESLEGDLLDKLNELCLTDVTEPVVTADNEKEQLKDAASRLLRSDNPVFNENRINNKIETMMDIIKKGVIPKGDKVIVVSQWTSMLKIVAKHLKTEKIPYDCLDGSIPVSKRGDIVNNFNNPDHEVRVLLLSLTAGGVGLNLVGANHLVLLDLHWNPQLEAQAQDRIYRVGQKKPVKIYKIVTVDTIEERIKALQDKKLLMAGDILSGNKQMTHKLSLDDLKMLFSMPAANQPQT